MPSLSEIRTLGSVGSILVVIGSATGTQGGLIGIIGFILILVATKRIADMTDNSIFRNMLLSVIFSVIGLVIFLAAVLSAIYSFAGLTGVSVSLSTTSQPADLGSFIASILPGLIVSWVFFLGSSIFLKRSYDMIATHLGVDYFRTTGLLYLIGALTSILLIGLIIVLVAEVFQILAFFSIPDQLSTRRQSTVQRGTPVVWDAFQSGSSMKSSCQRLGNRGFCARCSG